MPPAMPIRLGVISLGCPKNLVDTERALGQVVGGGVVLVEDIAAADWIVINTCGFIEEAKRESIETVLEIARLKEENPSLKIAVTGCLSQRYGADLANELPEADFFTGILTRRNVQALEREMTGRARPLPHLEDDDRRRLRITAKHIAYLRIAEGCDNRCSYCAIPDIRGPMRSRPIENVIADAEELLSDGAVEINVIAQDTCRYGIDLYGRERLCEVLAELARLNPAGWVRLLYAHPAHFTDDILAAIEKGPPIVPYIDLPLQHISDRILSRMGRQITRAQAEALVKNIRRRIPRVFIRTTFIVGFPTETDGEFRELVDFVAESRFERLGAFAYSREEGTPAFGFEGQIDEAEKERRLDILMETQRQIALEQNASLEGSTISGIIDGPSGRDTLELAGRTYGDAPEVDGTVLARGVGEPGEIVNFRITGVEEYDLVAEIER